MSIHSSTQQFSGGIASIIAGLIVVQTDSGKLGGMIGVCCNGFDDIGDVYAVFSEQAGSTKIA